MLGMEWRERKRVNGPSRCVLVEQIRIQLPGFKKEEIKWDLVVVRFFMDGWPKSNRSVLTLFIHPIMYSQKGMGARGRLQDDIHWHLLNFWSHESDRLQVQLHPAICVQ